MATDYLLRFDGALAARIRDLDAGELADLLADRFAAWRARGRRPFSEALSLALGTARPLRAIVEELLAEGCPLGDLRNDAVYDLCLQGEDVRLDYWGSYAEVFPGEAEGAVSSLEVLPGTEEELFVLLRPDHVDEIVRSLRAHAHELTAMSPARIEVIAELRDACAGEPEQRVAYCFDA
jgi:hypothetical protein